MTAEIRDVTDGVWIWRLEHPEWTAFGPRLFFRDNVPRTRLEPIFAGYGLELPGGPPWHQQAVVPALCALLELPVSHGEPVHDRAAFERALALPPWSGSGS